MRAEANPLRQCLGCKQVRPKRELLRLIRLPDGTARYDHTYRRDGRGGYVCPHLPCIQRAFKGRHPRFSLIASDMGALVAQMQGALTGRITQTLRQAEKMGYVHEGPGGKSGDIIIWVGGHGLTGVYYYYRPAEDGFVPESPSEGGATKVVTGGYPMMSVLLRDLKLLERLSSEGL